MGNPGNQAGLSSKFLPLWPPLSLHRCVGPLWHFCFCSASLVVIAVASSLPRLVLEEMVSGGLEALATQVNYLTN